MNLVTHGQTASRGSEAGFEVTASEIISVGRAALSDEELSAVAGGANVSYFKNKEGLDISSLRDRGGATIVLQATAAEAAGGSVSEDGPVWSRYARLAGRSERRVPPCPPAGLLARTGTSREGGLARTMGED